MKHDKCFGLHLGGENVLSTFSPFFFNQYLIITVLGLIFLDIYFTVMVMHEHLNILIKMTYTYFQI